MHTPKSIDDIVQIVRSESRVQCRGGGTKSALSRNANVDLSRLNGVTEYDASEFTFTAKAATPLSDINKMLAENSQYLPFDPPFAKQGATIAGTLAAGLSGPGRYRYGGVRDFVLGVRMVTGAGNVVFGGGKVVKNAAGFDIPKLMVGARGQFGVLAEVTFKVFPHPEKLTTLQFSLPSIKQALPALLQLAGSQMDLVCLDLDESGTVSVRVGGLTVAADERVNRIKDFVGSTGELLTGEEEANFWKSYLSFEWVPSDSALIKIPLTAAQIVKLESSLPSQDLPRRYSVGGNVLWLAWPVKEPLDQLSKALSNCALTGLCLTGSPEMAEVCGNQRNPFQESLLAVFDPERKLTPSEKSTAIAN